jgi:RNA polymerase sigma-70 factor (ECF subfamily)
MDAERQLRDDFEGFYRTNLEVALAFCFARTGDAELSADLAAESFAAALAARESYSARLGSPRGWLLGIAAHKTVDALRRGHVERRAQRQLGMEQITWSEDDLDHVARTELWPVERLLADLPADQRQALQAHVVEEVGYRDLARLAGVSQPAMRQRVSRGLAALRRQLTKESR